MNIIGSTIVGSILTYTIYGALGVCSVLALAFIINRLVYLRTVQMDVDNFMVRIRKAVESGRVMEGIAICEATPNPISNVVKAALAHYSSDREVIREAIEAAAGVELPKLERFLIGLSTISTISPLLGLLGTVIGMIMSFSVIGTEGTGNPYALAGGISYSLLTTAMGLVVAIPATIFYNYFTNRITTIASHMEERSFEVIDVVTQGEKKSESKRDAWAD